MHYVPLHLIFDFFFLISFRFISVKADGVKTDCSGSNPNCATHATCAAAGTCSCDKGYKVLTTGLCTGEVDISR